jgi:hypothetical protein
MSGLWILFCVMVATGEILPAPAAAPTKPSTSVNRSTPSADALSRDASALSGTASSHDPDTASVRPTLPGEPLPAPRMIGGQSKASKMVAANIDMQLPPPGPGPDSVKVGWGIDKTDNALYMVVQIAPDAIAAFAAGVRGQELPCTIPPALRGRVEKVIIRIGTGSVEQNPPESELVRMPLSNSNSARIANLDMRSSVAIDTPRTGSEVIPTAGTTQLPAIPGFSSAPSMTNEVLPTNVPPAMPSTMNPPPLNTPVYSNPVVTNPPPALPSTSPTAASNPAWNTTASTPSTYTNDGFQPAPRSVPSSLIPFGSSRTPSTVPTATSTQGNVTYGGTAPNPNAQGSLNGQGGAYNYNPNGVPLVASNPPGVYPPGMGPNPGSDPGLGYGPGGQSSQPNYGNYAGGNFAGAQPYGNPNYNPNHTLTTPVLPIPQLANRPFPSTSGSSTSGTLPTSRDFDRTDLNGNETNRSSSFTRSASLVPFFFVLSFILNIYFGLWLNHLSVKYRHLLGSVRGLSPAELDR